MSLIQKIRDKATWIVFGAIGLSLTAFILQDAFSSGRGSMSSNTTTIGKVNGKAIARQDFEQKIDFYEQANKGQAQRDQLIGSVWEYMVSQTISEQEYEKLGLKVTAKELSDILFGKNPPQWMQQAFTDPATGVFNVNAAKQQFSEIKKKADDPQVATLYEGYIQPTIDQALRQKYQSLLANAVYVPKWMAEKMNTDASLIAKISYVSVPYTLISDSAVKVSDDEITAYIKKHAKLFEKDEETRTISFVPFNAAANAADSAEVLSQLKQVQPEFGAATDNKSYLSAKGSEMPYYDSYLGKDQIKQKVNDSLFTLLPGQTYGPYIDGSNMVIAKMVGVMPIPDSAKVRHILVGTHQQDQSGGLMRIRLDSAAIKRLDSAITAINSGASFDSVCAVYSEDPGSKDKGGVYDFFPSGQMDEAFNDFAFTGKTGEKKVVKTVYGYHYVEILGQAGLQTGYKIAYFAKPIAASQETINTANTAATQFAASSRDKKLFDANAAKLKKLPMAAPEVKQNDFMVTGAGSSRELVKWAYEHKVGEVSEPIEVDEKFIVAMLTGISKKGLPDAASARVTAEPAVKSEKKAKQIISAKIKGNTLEEIARNAGTQVQVADSVSFGAFVIPSVGNEPIIIGAAFNKQIQGKISTPLAGSSGVFVLKGSGMSAIPTLSNNTETQQEGVINMLKQQIGYRFIDFLKKGSDIEDYRSTFY